jgi:hypothetical protein
MVLEALEGLLDREGISAFAARPRLQGRRKARRLAADPW